MSRMIHIWYLCQKGYSSSLYVGFSKYINEDKRKYYKAFKTIEDNYKITKVLDITPFVKFYCEQVYNNVSLNKMKNIKLDGVITKREKELYDFCVNNYGEEEFSTKMLEHDSKLAAYATIRDFVIKFAELGYLEKINYSRNPRYKIKN